jgi:hypothetical protein
MSCILLTSLVLHTCQVGLQGLPALTGLQHLHLDLRRPHNKAASNAAIVADAIPQLLQLTSLQLGGPASQDAAPEHLSRLTALQQLELTDAECTTASFLQLPSSLTNVVVRLGFHPDNPELAPTLTFSSRSSPGLSQLTGLQELTVQGGNSSPRFHVELLSALTGLKKLSVNLCKVMAEPQEPTLVLLTTLKCLEHLELHRYVDFNYLLAYLLTQLLNYLLTAWVESSCAEAVLTRRVPVRVSGLWRNQQPQHCLRNVACLVCASLSIYLCLIAATVHGCLCGAAFPL